MADKECFLCRKLLKPSNRRTLGSSEKGLRFLESFGEISRSVLTSKSVIYVCKPCLGKLEKGDGVVSDLKQLLCTSRQYFGLREVNIRSIIDGDDDDTEPDSEKTDSDGSVQQIFTSGRKRVHAANYPVFATPKRKCQEPAVLPGESPLVRVAICRPSKKATKFCVASKYKRLVMSTRYKKSPYTARVMLRPHTSLRLATLKQIHQVIRREIRTICSRKSGDSVLRLSNIAAITKFSWGAIIRELKLHTPTLYSVIRSALKKKKSYKVKRYAVGVNASVLLKTRNKNIALFQAVLSIIMYSGHCSKQVFNRLNRVGVCLSHNKTIQLIRQLGEGHDNEVKRWLYEVQEVIGNGGSTIESATDMTEDAMTSDSETETEWTSTEASEDELSSSSVSEVGEVTEETSPTARISGYLTYILVGDNWDKNILASHMSMVHQSQSLHYFHCYGALDRIDFNHLSNDVAIGDVSKLPVSTFLLNVDDCSQLKDNYAILIGQEVTKKLSFFKIFDDCTPKQITHEYSQIMGTKSKLVPLGILPNNENMTEEMVEIMDKLSDYVPEVKDSKSGESNDYPLPFFGDMLTAARARTAQETRVTSKGKKALRGLFPIAADWHAKVNYMEIMWMRLYKGGSSLEGGTLQQIRNLINRRNISAATNVSGHVNDVQYFLELVIRCHILAVTMHFFSMKNIDDKPHTSGFPDDVAQLSPKERWKLFLKRLREIVDKYVIPKQFNLSDVSEKEKNLQSGNPHGRRVQQEHSYGAYQACPPQGRQLPRSITEVTERSDVSAEKVRKTAVDGVFNYASALLNDGLLFFEFIDAIRQGDGRRILRCWKAMLIYFHHARHYNYAKEAIYLLAAVNATATPHLAAQITWSRVVNTSGKPRGNIPVDLHNEHLNRALKTSVAGIGANANPKTIIQCAKSLKGLMDTTGNFAWYSPCFIRA